MINPHVLAMLISLAVVSASIAQSPLQPTGPSPATKQAFEVSLLTEVIDVSPTRALEFVKKFGEAAPNQHGAILAELMKQYADREAPQNQRSISVPAVSVHDGQRAVIEMIREYRYPTEFVNKDGRAMPSAFETRNIGTTAEFAPHRAPDGKTWDVEVVFQLVHLAEVKIFGQGLLAVEQPDFATRKLTARVTLQPGIPKFVGIVGPDPQVDQENKEPVRIVILTAAITAPEVH